MIWCTEEMLKSQIIVKRGFFSFRIFLLDIINTLCILLHNFPLTFPPTNAS